MKKLLFLSFILAFSLATVAQTKSADYDSVLAKKLGADDYGMRRYVIAFLKAGPNKIIDSAQRMQIQMAHLKNIGRLAKEGKLVLAGPFLDHGNYAGIYIFNVTTVEEAKTLTETDPAIKAGVFDMELHPWYGSAAMMQIVETHNKLQKYSLTD